MDDSDLLPRTTLVLYRVTKGRGAPRDYQAVFLRSLYHGARPGTDATPQVTYQGYMSRIEPGCGLVHVLDVREPHATEEEVEAEARAFLAARHDVAPADVEQLDRADFVERPVTTSG